MIDRHTRLLKFWFSPIPDALKTAECEHRATPSTGLERAIARSQDYFRRTQEEDGYWWGELESNNTMEAEYIMLSHFLGRKDEEKWRKLTNYIVGKQREDGSWGQYYEAPGDLSTSVECYFALKLAGYPAESDPLRRAREFIRSRGGVPGCRVFTKIWLAMFGQWDWKGTPNMPPELMLLPSWFPFNIYEFSQLGEADGGAADAGADLPSDLRGAGLGEH